MCYRPCNTVLYVILQCVHGKDNILNTIQVITCIVYGTYNTFVQLIECPIKHWPLFLLLVDFAETMWGQVGGGGGATGVYI